MQQERVNARPQPLACVGSGDLLHCGVVTAGLLGQRLPYKIRLVDDFERRQSAVPCRVQRGQHAVGAGAVGVGELA
jgi:hypothetical protein